MINRITRRLHWCKTTCRHLSSSMNCHDTIHNNKLYAKHAIHEAKCPKTSASLYTATTQYREEVDIEDKTTSNEPTTTTTGTATPTSQKAMPRTTTTAVPTKRTNMSKDDNYNKEKRLNSFRSNDNGVNDDNEDELGCQTRDRIKVRDII